MTDTNTTDTTTEGVTTLACRSRSAKAVADHLVALIEGAGLLIFARVDHGANAVDVGLELRPTELIVFGHPKGGTPLMQERQLAGLDLPFRALVWQDAAGQVLLSYNTPAWLAERHHLAASGPAIAAIEAGMARLAAGASEFTG